MLKLQNLILKVAAQYQLELLRLDLECDVKDFSIAQHVAELLSPLRNLATYSIMLSQNPQWNISVFSQELVCSLTSTTTREEELHHQDYIAF